MTERADVDERTRALRTIADIAREHSLSAADVAAALREASATESEDRRQHVLVRVLGYLGGTFVFAGIGVFIALQWDQLNSAARVLVTLGSGLAAFVLGVLSEREARFRNAATPLLLVAGALEPTGMFVAFDEFGSGGDWRWAALVTSGAMALQFAAAFGAIRRSTPVFLTILFGAWFLWTALDLVGIDDTVIAIVVGGSLLLTSVAADQAGWGTITPLWYFFGAAFFLYGLFDGIKHTPFEILFIAAAAGLVYASALLRSRTLLGVATLAILAYTGWFTGQHFVDSIGWPLALVAFGLVLIGLSALAFRIDRQYVRRQG
jgi:hypothetical protein